MCTKSKKNKISRKVKKESLKVTIVFYKHYNICVSNDVVRKNCETW